MKELNINARGPTIHTTVYDKFKGVDFSTAPALVDRSRSPWAPNLISDTGGMPEKRLGWRTLFSVEAPVNGIFYGFLSGEAVFLIHGGTKLYRWTEEGTTLLREEILNGKSTSFTLNNELWILTGREFLNYDGTEIKDVTADAYIPLTVISRPPVGGGTRYEEINLLQPKRKNSFLADGTAKEYKLDAQGLDETAITATVNEEAKTEGTDFTVDRTKGTVTFKTIPPAPAVKGYDNVEITFAKTVAGYADKIKKCTIGTLYGNRIFLSGNPDSPSFDYQSAFLDPSYFPDTGFARIGVDGTAIMGYSRIGSYLAIIKEDNQQDSTIFLRRESSIDGKTVFPAEQGVSGVGAISKRCFCNLMDEPLFLAKTGIYTIKSNNITAEKSVQNRSFYVDAILNKEENLQDAVATEWNGYYILCVNERCYILDGRQQRTYQSQSLGDFIYECYHWEHVPAVCFLEYSGALYFGTADGKLCKFNTDVSLMTRYNDDGEPVICEWSTKSDDDGDISKLKTMIKKGNSVTIKPYIRSSAKILLRTEKDFGKLIRYGTMDIFDWDNLDFERISFNSNDAPQEIMFQTKIKKYKRLQIIIRNDGFSEGFGIFGITKHHTVGNYAK